MTTDSSPSAASSESVQPCPTPLVWQEVVRVFDTQQTQLDFQTSLGHLKITSFGSGQPLLFLPGHVATPRVFALIAWTLREEYRCLLIQHPLWTKTPAIHQVIPTTARMIAEFLERGMPQGVDLFGNSFGGQVALQLMLDFPQLINKAVLQSAWAHRQLNMVERTTLRCGTFVPGSVGRVPLWKTAQRQNHRLWFPPFDETRFDFLLEETRQTRTRSASRRLLAAHVTDLRDRLGEITTPVHLLRCEGDGPLLDQLQDVLARGLPKVTDEEMHTTGHYPVLTHPHRVAKLIRHEFPIRDEPCTAPF